MKSTFQSSNDTNSRMDASNYDEDNTNTSSASTTNQCLDFSLIRKPIVTSVTGFPEAKKAYDFGTEEIRKLLANECDLIYECKVCRNIFRSLANFVSHKRVYCKTKFNTSHHFHFNSNEFIDQDISTIIQEEESFLNQQKNKRRTDSEFRDLSSVVERLHRKQIKKHDLKLQDFYEQIVANKHTTFDCNESFSSNSSEAGSSKSIVIQLNSVPDTKNAVYQTLKTNNDDNIKAEINEVHDMLENNNAIIGPDGKVSPLDGTLKLRAGDFCCEICEEKFVTEKTLKIHIEKKHIPSTTVYQCPSPNCSESFLQPAAVFKHLSTTHKKTQKRIKLMRDKIINKPKRSDEIKVKLNTTNRETQKALDNELNAWSGEKGVNSSTCPYCNKSFDRKAVLTVHVANCSAQLQKPTNARKRPRTPKEIVFAKQIEAINKRKRKGPIVIRNEEPDIKDEIEEEYSSSSEQADEEIVMHQKESENVNEVAHEVEQIKDDDEKEKLVVVEDVVKIKRRPKKTENSTAKENDQINKIIPCALCSKKFATSTNLKRHVAMFHFRQNRFGCKLCEYRGYRRVDTLSHLGAAHNIQGEKESLNDYIEVSTKSENDQRPPMNADKGCDTNVTFSSVVASIVNSTDKSLSITIEPKPQTEPPAKKRKLSQLLEIDELPKIEIEVEGIDCIKPETPPNDVNTMSKSRISSPGSEPEPENKRPTRNRVKTVRKDFVYNLNTIIKQEAEMHREQQLQQSSAMPLRSQRRRNTICDMKETGPKTRSTDQPPLTCTLNTENIDQKPNFPFSLGEVVGAAHKMAEIEVKNQRACFNRPPELPERPLIPTKLTPPRPESKSLQLINGSGAKNKKKRNNSNTNDIKPKEFKRTLSFTDTLLLQTDATRGKFLLEAASKTTSEPIMQFPPSKPPFSLAEFTSQLSSASSSSSAGSAARRTKATKKLELSSKEQSQIEMLQRFRNQQQTTLSSQPVRSRSERRSVPEPDVTLTPIKTTGGSSSDIVTGKRISVLQRLAENSKKRIQDSVLPATNASSMEV